MSAYATPAVTGAAIEKLPVLAIVGRAYGATLANLATFFRISWFWCLVLLAVQAMSATLLPAWMTNPTEIMQLDAPALLMLSFAGLLNGMLLLPIFASIAVTWHRLLLLGEKPAPAAFIRLDGLVWSYVGLAALLAVVRFLFSLPQVAMSVERSAGGIDTNLLRIIAGLLSVGVLVVLPRLSLALPGCAIGQGGAGLASGYAAGRGNTLRLCAGALLCFLPAIAVGIVTFGIWPGHQVMLGDSALAQWVRAGQSMLWPLLGIVFVSFLSYAYGHLLPGEIAARRR